MGSELDQFLYGHLERDGDQYSSPVPGQCAGGETGSGPNSWSGLFNANVALPSFGGLGGDMLQPIGMANNPMTQALANPISNPLTQNLTGNFPRRGWY